MDVKKIGQFLAQLRKERGMTQEQLGEKLGVTNKTVSRWENGNYMPPVEILQLLSELYGLTINEILSAQRLSPAQYQEKAEENIKTVLRHSSFKLKERIRFFKKKWIKEHRFWQILDVVTFIALSVLIVWLGETYLWLASLSVAAIVRLLSRREKMNQYIDDRVFGGTGNENRRE